MLRSIFQNHGKTVILLVLLPMAPLLSIVHAYQYSSIFRWPVLVHSKHVSWSYTTYERVFRGQTF